MGIYYLLELLFYYYYFSLGLSSPRGTIKVVQVHKCFAILFLCCIVANVKSSVSFLDALFHYRNALINSTVILLFNQILSSSALRTLPDGLKCILTVYFTFLYVFRSAMPTPQRELVSSVVSTTCCSHPVLL